MKRFNCKRIIMTSLTLCLFLLSLIVTGLVIVGHLIITQFRKRRVSKPGGFTIGIFHPYCNAGGGGEKVLWCAVQALQKQYKNVDIVVYTGDVSATPEEIVALAAKRLNTVLLRPLKFVYLRGRGLVEADKYPVCTLLGQSLGSVLLGLEAMWRFLPDVYIDTMGYAFTMPLFSLVGGCKVGCYVHYPTITPDMLQRVSERVEAHNNRPIFARSPILTAGKLVYYRAFAWLYKLCGRSADVIMTNSSWTKDHIVNLWQREESTHLVYPPCDVGHLKKLKNKDSGEVRILSLGQFRPEKDHPLQIKALHALKTKVADDIWSKVKLVVIGSCRNAQDEARVNDIKRLCEELSVSDHVEFKINISFDELQEQLSLGTIGLHTMWNEHFGIGVVECMAAGLIMLAHRSGGPMMDIVDVRKESQTGFLAETAEEFADTILQIINTPKEQLEIIKKSSRASMDRFSIESFEKGLISATSQIFEDKKTS